LQVFEHFPTHLQGPDRPGAKSGAQKLLPCGADPGAGSGAAGLEFLQQRGALMKRFDHFS